LRAGRHRADHHSGGLALDLRGAQRQYRRQNHAEGLCEKIEDQYGKADRIWLMDRGVPTEEVLAEMRASDPPIHYLVGTPKGRLTKLEAELLPLEWQKAKEGVDVKLLPREGELYVLARSNDRVAKERAMRRRQLKKLWARLKELQQMAPAERHAVAQAWSGQEPISIGLAPGQNRGRPRGRTFLLLAQGQTARGSSAGRPLSASLQLGQRKSRPTLAALCLAYPDRGSVQKSQR
jgi:hypothetical protein